MARISPFPQFNPTEKDLNRFVKGLKLTVDSMIQEVNRIDNVAGSTGDILAQLQAIEARINALIAQIVADIAEVRELLAEAKVLAMETAQLRTDIDALTVRVTAAEATIVTNTAGISTATSTANAAQTTATAAQTTANSGVEKADAAQNTADSGVQKANAAQATADAIESDVSFISSSYVKDASVTDDTLNITVRKNGVETNVSFEGGDPDTFLKTIQIDNDVEVKITDQADTETSFYALPTFDINQAGLIPQVNATGETINWVSPAAASGTADEAPCFLYAAAIDLKTRSPIFAVSGDLPCRTYTPSTDSYEITTISTTQALIPCRTYISSTDTYTETVLPLQ